MPFGPLIGSRDLATASVFALAVSTSRYLRLEIETAATTPRDRARRAQLTSQARR